MEKKSSTKKKVTRKSAKVKHKQPAPRGDKEGQEGKEGQEETHLEKREEGGGGKEGETETKRTSSSMSMTSGRKITEDERKEIAEAFRVLDEDGDGKLGFEEMKKLLQSQFMTFTDAAATDVIKELDEDGSGEIEFDEFEKYVIKNNLCKPTVEEFSAEMKEAFMMFDSDNNGFIDADEFRALMGSIGDKMSEEEIQEMMKEADTNGDGFIDYKEFCAHMATGL